MKRHLSIRSQIGTHRSNLWLLNRQLNPFKATHELPETVRPDVGSLTSCKAMQILSSAPSPPLLALLLCPLKEVILLHSERCPNGVLSIDFFIPACLLFPVVLLKPAPAIFASGPEIAFLLGLAWRRA